MYVVLMGKHDVIHRTGSTVLVATLPEEDQATITDNMHRKFSEVWMCGFRVCLHTAREKQRGTCIAISPTP